MSASAPTAQPDGAGMRARARGAAPGLFSTGPLNAITDVGEVAVGHLTLVEGDDVRTGVTAVMPHADNLHRWRPPAGFACGNGFGKFLGAWQVRELGELETPIALTNTLSVSEAAAGVIGWTLEQDGNAGVRSVNAVVGETNDSLVNDIRRRAVRPEHVRTAIAAAERGPVPEGSVGAGTGTQLFGWKGGMGTSSRILPGRFGGHAVGVLIQTNYGGTPIIAGHPVHDLAGRNPGFDVFAEPQGSVIVIVATDAPLCAADLARMAKRTFLGLARTGSSMGHASGEFALAFSTASAVRRDRDGGAQTLGFLLPTDDAMAALFQAVVEATEEAALNALFAATTIESRIGRLERAPEPVLSVAEPSVGRAQP